VLVFLAKGEDGELFIQYGSYGLLRVREGHVASANRDTARANHLGSEDIRANHLGSEDINEDINKCASETTDLADEIIGPIGPIVPRNDHRSHSTWRDGGRAPA
jgi:hypothetical protein